MKILNLNKLFYNIKQYQPFFIQLSNYLIILYAFFLPLSNNIARLLFTIIVVLFLLSGNLKEKIKFAIKDKIIQSIVLFYVMHIVWLIGSSNIEMAFFQLKSIKYILYIMIFITLIKQEFVYKIISAFLIAIFFSEIVSYLITFKIIAPIYNATISNPVPFMLSHISYSSVLSLSLSIILYLFFIKQNKLLKFFYFLFFISASINMFIIESRMGYILYSTSVFVVILIVYKNNIRKIILFVFLFIAVGYSGAYNFSNSFQNRVDQAIESVNSVIEDNNYYTSIGVRVGYHVYSFLALKENLILGVGTGDHTDEVRNAILKYETVPENKESMLYAISSGNNANLHSEYLDTVVQFGLIGLLIFLNIFYQIYKYKQTDIYLKSIQLITLTSMIIISIPSVIFIYNSVGKVITLLIAVTLKLYYDKKEN